MIVNYIHSGPRTTTDWQIFGTIGSKLQTLVEEVKVGTVNDGCVASSQSVKTVPNVTATRRILVHMVAPSSIGPM